MTTITSARLDRAPSLAAASNHAPWGSSLFVVAFAYAAFAQGGFYWEQARLIAPALCVAALMLTRARATDELPRLAIAGFAVLGVGLLASAAMNEWPSEMTLPIATLAAAMGALFGARAMIRLGLTRRLLETIAAVGSALAVLGLIGLAFHWDPLAMKAQGIWRAATPLTYANAAGSFLTLALPAALLLERERPRALTRIAAAAITAGLITTLSRGGILGAIVMAMAIVAVGGRSIARIAARPLMSGLVAAAGFVPSIASPQARPLYALAGCALAAVVAIPRPRSHQGSGARRAAIALIVLAGLGVVTTALVMDSPNGRRLVASRVGAASEDRLRFWGSAIDVGVDQPWFGTGPGTFEGADIWKGENRIIRYAHNEYLQAFAETGIVGVASLAIAIALFGAWALRSRRVAQDRVVWAVAISACAAFMVHGAFDFMWRLPAIVACAFIWLAIATTPGEGQSKGDQG